MAPYFDSANAAHQALLPTPQQGASALSDVAELAEADVINHFTRRAPAVVYGVAVASTHPAAPFESVVVTGTGEATLVGTDRYVYLRGYRQDASDAEVDPDLKVALRRTIAEVIAWRLRQWGQNPLVQNEAAQPGASRTYRPELLHPFPPGFDRWLLPFDTRLTSWAL